MVVIAGVGEKKSCPAVAVLPLGLCIDRGVNTGASGFNFDPYKHEVIRSCQRMHIKMILKRHLYLFLVVRGCLQLRGLCHPILGRLFSLRSIFLTIRSSRSLRSAQSLCIVFTALVICVLFLRLDENLRTSHQ